MGFHVKRLKVRLKPKSVQTRAYIVIREPNLDDLDVRFGSAELLAHGYRFTGTTGFQFQEYTGKGKEKENTSGEERKTQPNGPERSHKRAQKTKLELVAM